MERIGFYGGSFDPIHYAHLNLAEHAVSALQLDRVLFMPSGGNPYYKEEHEPASPHHRLKMIEKAINGQSRFEVSDYEIMQDEFCYTVDTLRYLWSLKPNESEIILLAGSDWKNKIPNWKDGEQLLEEFRVAYFARPGTQNEMKNVNEPNVEYIDMPMLDISSSLVREQIQQGISIDDLVPDSVAQYIQKHNLYR